MNHAHEPIKPTKHLVLTGLMGSGKTTLGQYMAQQLRWPFIDLDAYIAEKENKSIAELFKQVGELGFRAKERAALRELLQLNVPHVIALGGGTLQDMHICEQIYEHGLLIYLKASVPFLSQRLEQSHQKDKRPLLAHQDVSVVLERLLEQRKSLYEKAHFTVSIEDKKKEDILNEILSFLGMHIEKTKFIQHALSVKTSHSRYSILFFDSLSSSIAETITSCMKTDRAIIVTDTNIRPLHAQSIQTLLESMHKKIDVIAFDAGEKNKNAQTVDFLYNQLFTHQVHRKDTLIALGGGVVGDLTGFVASTYMRGIDFIQIPTSTLAAVDSSVGGKTGYNTKFGKNLIGTFYPPQSVLVCKDLLKTQSQEQHIAGLIEAIKMAMTFDAPLFEDIAYDILKLKTCDAASLLSILYRSVSIKARVVAQDEFESGLRAALNYGHTIGHAIEAASDFRIPHGFAVGLGMLAEAEWASTCYALPRFDTILKAMLDKLGAPTAWREYAIDAHALSLDKKREHNHMTMPVVTSIGHCELKKIPFDSLIQFVHQPGG